MSMALPQTSFKVFSEIFKQQFPRTPVDKFSCKYSYNNEEAITNLSSPCVSFRILT